MTSEDLIWPFSKFQKIKTKLFSKIFENFYFSSSPLGGIWTYLELSNLVVILVVKFWICQIGPKTTQVKHHCCQSLESKLTIDLSAASTIGTQWTVQGIDPWSLEISANISMEWNRSRCGWDENCLWEFLKKTFLSFQAISSKQSFNTISVDLDDFLCTCWWWWWFQFLSSLYTSSWRKYFHHYGGATEWRSLWRILVFWLRKLH